MNLFAGRPMFVVEPQNTTVSHGENVLLDCIAQGEPEPSMRWQKEGFRVLPVGRVAILPNNTLKIVAAQLTDSGAYMCLAENQMGRAVMTIHLTVMGECLTKKLTTFKLMCILTKRDYCIVRLSNNELDRHIHLL